MTEAQRKNIGRGVRNAAMRKRQSEAMKASWMRRRALNGGVAGFHAAPKPPLALRTPLALKRSNLRQVAELLGIDTDAVIRHEIKRVLEI